MTLKEIEKAGFDAVKKLRAEQLANGRPFMINSHLLPSTQCYLEYPDDSIVIATINKSKDDFEIIKSLSKNEAKALRKKYRLLYSAK
jgi:hypothetical protein